MRDYLIKRSWFTMYICADAYSMAVTWQRTSCTAGHLTFLKTSQLAGCWWTGASRPQDISSKQGDRLQTVSKFVYAVIISKLIHFQSKKQYEMEICFDCYYISDLNQQWNTQLIESCIHVSIITARRTGWWWIGNWWTFNQDRTTADNDYLSNSLWPSVLTVPTC